MGGVDGGEGRRERPLADAYRAELLALPEEDADERSRAESWGSSR